jgi:electron transfer flavoprotein-quinone oxidoreductase
MIARLLEGAEMVEYAAHNVPKGYKCMLQTPYASGYLASGDALGAFVKVGPLLDGMRRAIASGMMAGETYVKAGSSGDFGAASLSTYKELLAPIYRAVARSRRDAQISESRMVYQTLPKLIFSLGPLAYEARIRSESQTQEIAAIPARRVETLQRVQLGTSLLNYDEDKVYSHIKVDLAKGSASSVKPWVPCCPVNCYTVVTSKGVYASFKDLYDHNADPMRERFEYPSNLESSAVRTVAAEETLRDVASGQLRFDHVACVACGTCGEIGPRDVVAFNHEREGHGVRYRYG